MHHWTKGIMGDDPAYLAVGTEVSAKYKGAFCEAKVRKVVRSVKCKVTFKLGLGSAVVADDQVRGTLRVGSLCEVKHPERKEFVEATINKITDSSQYTVVFDDGDITTLRRTALCLKSGRHFAVSETLDQLPLTHPEHFSNPVVGGRKGRRSRQAHEDTSDEEESGRRGSKKKEEKEADIGRVVCVELGDKKKLKDNWFPGLVVAPTAQDTVRIRVKDEYLVRSFRDGRYFTVPKKEATEFTREVGSKVDNNTLRTAVEKALLFLDRDELPPHWDRDVLFGTDESSAVSDSDGGLDSDSSDDEPREEKDHFVAQLYKFMDDRGTPINNEPTICNKDIDLYKLFKVVHKLGGYNRVTNHNQWKTIARKVGFDQSGPSIKNLVKQAYKKFLHSFEEFYRKLGCTMVNHPRHSRPRHHGGRSLIRDRDRATPVNIPKEKDKVVSSTTDSVTDPHDLPEKRENVVTPVAETSRSKVEESKLTVREVRVDEKASTDKDKSCAKDESSSQEKVGKKEKDVRKEREVKKDAKKEKEVPKKEKDTKKEKVVETKSKSSDLPKETVKSIVAKEPEPKEDVLPVKSPDKDVNEDSPPKSLPPARREAKPREDKGKKLRECKRQYGRQSRKDDEASRTSAAAAAAEEEKVAVKIKEEQAEEAAATAVSVKDDERDESVKMSEDEKSDDSKKAVAVPMEYRREEAVTRSKSREDLKPDLALAERRRSRDFDKPITPRPRRLEDDEDTKKKGRKRKDTDPKQNPEEVLGQLAVGIGVGVGDKLKVYYGPTHESKVTYEAKVIEVEKETYLVHYTGWNTRYDEWIKRGRIAENLSWTPSRAKRLKLQQAKASAKKTTAASLSVLGKRGRPSATGRDSGHRARSTTPSSVTSSSSRTKSPGTPAPRPPRPPPGPEYLRRRTRRMSGHTDASVASEASEASESDEYSEVEVEPTRTRSRSERIDKDEAASKLDQGGVREEGKRSSLRRKAAPLPRKEEVEDETEEDSGEQSAGPGETRAAVEKRRSTRSRKPAPVTPEQLARDEVVKREADSDEEQPHEPKGRDFDLNQIRSELKGIEKAVKPPQEVAPPTGAEEKGAPPTILDDKTDLVDSSHAAEKEAVVEKAAEPAGKAPAAESAIVCNTDDIYEFKEPEPFEFEVRAKRELLMPEERAKSSRKSGGKAAEAEVVAAPVQKAEKTPPSRKKLVRNASSKGELKETPPSPVPPALVPAVTTPPSAVALVAPVPTASSPADAAAKKRFRRTPTGKKTESAPPEMKKELAKPQQQSRSEAPDPVTPQKAAPTSACEDAFNKLCESPVFRPAISRRTPSPNGSRENEPLSHLFGELPGEGRDGDDGEDDNEDRLVISEPDDGEMEPLFTYSQRHHEELLPTLMADVAVPPPLNLVEKPASVASIAPTQNTSVFPSFQKSADVPAVKSVLTTKGAGPRRASVKSPSLAKSPSLGSVKSPSLASVKTPNLASVKSPSIAAVIKIPSLTTVKSPSIASVKTPVVSSVKSPGVASVKSPTIIKCPSPRVNSPSLSVKSPSSSVVPVSKGTSSSISSLNVKTPSVASVSPPSSSAAKTPVVLMKKEAAPLPKVKEELAAASSKVTASQPIEDDVITALLLKESADEFEDDPISAAIQRVISQSVAKEDVEKSPVVVPKPAEEPLESKAAKSDLQVPMFTEHQRKEALKRKSGGRKPILSQEFVDDSDDSDSSSDEEPRLVIDRMDDDDSLSHQDDEGHLAQLASKHFAFDKARQIDSSFVDVEDKKIVAKDDSALLIQPDASKLLTGMAGKSGKRILEKKPKLDEVKETTLPFSRVEDSGRRGASVPKDERKTAVDTKIPLKTDSNVGSQVPIVVVRHFVSQTVLETEEVKEELESNLSLLCEETIPGSPTPVQEPPEREDARHEAPTQETKSLFLEMPFASAPGTSIVSGVPSLKPAGSVSAEAMEAALKALPKPSLVGPLVGVASRKVDEAAAVLENTPPTTPDSSMSIASNSPREERVGLSPTLDMETFKSRVGSFEDSSAEGHPHKADHYSDMEDSLLNVEVSNNSSDTRLVSGKKLSSEMEGSSSTVSPKKQQQRQPRSRKRSECGGGSGDVVKRLKLAAATVAGRAVVRSAAPSDSDDDDTSENSVVGCVPLTSSENILLSRSPRPSRYNFFVELDPELDGTQRIAVLQQKLQELRKTYLNVKSELAGIDRRRKKLRRREREEKATKQEVACS